MSSQEFPGGTQGPLAFRKSQRISITLPQAVHEALLKTSAHEERSLSNLASYLLERYTKER